ncbi:hypothetical protein GFS31_34340 [Leptolyngbya sp. BL0902]|uniref:hypothetical protein n=1 Tax=Leptolyngbya sp. BL0902 TaxID=1115757 RepID=UPI0018E703A4|nr:hypothetical protein [Leptolyngbya sp. BL0902]QQE66733.1 hypothetical protein GFS31_34340 [Leptolyngbya sp. BL0902]
MKVKPVLIVGTVVLVGLAAGAGAGAAYYWMQATALPPAIQVANATSPELVVNQPNTSAEAVLAQKLATGEGVRYEGNNRIAITLTEAEMSQVILDGLAQVPEAQPLLQSAQGIQTTIEGQRVRTGLTLNPADLPTENLPPQAQRALGMATLLGNQSLYVGIEGSPRVENGRLVLDPNTQIQVGRINLTLSDLERATGLNADQLSRAASVTLPQTGLTLDGLEFSEGTAILRGAMP